MEHSYVTGVEIVLSILVTIITMLIGVIVSLLLRQQAKFEVRMEKHIHELRSDIHATSAQLVVLKTIIAMQLPPDVKSRLDQLSAFNEAGGIG